jgi:hypothetical protein
MLFLTEPSFIGCRRRGRSGTRCHQRRLFATDILPFRRLSIAKGFSRLIVFIFENFS